MNTPVYREMVRLLNPMTIERKRSISDCLLPKGRKNSLGFGCLSGYLYKVRKGLELFAHFCLLLAPLPVMASSHLIKEVHINQFAKPGEDITVVLQSLINRYTTIIIDAGTWYISPGIKLRNNITIRGENRDLSILRRNDLGTKMESGVLFYTERANIYIFTRKNPEDNFDETNVKYSNIHFEDLTLDFNRSPWKYSMEEFSKTNLFGIVFSHAKDCSVRNCIFEDSMNEYANNGSPAIAFFQSRDCGVFDCFSENVTFVKSIYSNRITVSKNHCENSVGTCIESICGSGGIFEYNYINGVYWNVSCVGINSTDCIVRNNVISSASNNTSCLTLGHRDYDYFSASGTIVSGNILNSEGVRAILIQNGSNICINNNVLSCVLTEGSPKLTSGCIVARGNVVRNITIVRNKIYAIGDKAYGAISYAGAGNLFIRENTINSKRGVVIYDGTDSVELEKNEVNSSEYSICVNSPKIIQIAKNRLTDGILIKGGCDISIQDNKFTRIPNSSYIYEKWGEITINKNTFVECSGIEQFFLINTKDKESTIDSACIRVSDNIVDGGPNAFVRFSEISKVGQLHNIIVNE